jgi:hypothetical protein
MWPQPGTDVMIFKFFSQKIAKILAFFAQTTATFCKNLIKTLVLGEKSHFVAGNWQKLLKICDHNIDP